jgi:hypothetical protein
MTLPVTPSGESIDKIKRLMRKMEGNVKMRRAVAAAIKAMGLPAPLPVEDSKRSRTAKPEPKQ